MLRLQSMAFQSLWRDEADAVRFALAPLPDVIRTFSQPGFNGPLYFLLLRGWIGLAGQGEFAIRFPSLIFGVISLALIYSLGTRLFSRPIGLIAATLLAMSGYHVWYSQEAKMYTLITALALAAIYCLRRGLEDGRARFWIGMVVCTSLAMYAHILAALIIPVELLLAVAWWPHAEDLHRRRLKPALLSLALLTVPYVPLAVWQLPLVFQPGETGFNHYTLGQMFNVLNGAYTRGILNSLDDTWGAIVAGLAAALALFGVLTRLSKNDRAPSAVGLAIWLALPVLAIWVVSLNRPLFTDRYVIWIMPAYYLAIALGLDAVWHARSAKPLIQWAVRAAAALSWVVLISVGALSLTAQATTPYKSDFRSAAKMVAAAIQPADVLVFQIPYVQYTFDYYYESSYVSLDGPYTDYSGNNEGYLDSEAAVFVQLDQVFQGKSGVWLIASEVETRDHRNLLQRWLDAHGAVTQQASFAQVTVTRYELK
ncbi:MAG TPA: glycosyltransferase family 39 protein [Anaerolineae bacterium]|nr:glycosyltransferase family 39 protein [Anaerolineae bacterium]